MDIQLNIPEYLSVRQWKQFNSLEHLTPSEKMIHIISVLSGRDKNEIRECTPASLKVMYDQVLELFEDINPSFYPIFELDGQLYGYSSMSKMTLGEYVDLERLSKNPHENLEEIMAILFRPITKHKFGGLKWAVKNTFKIGLGDAENLFKYYELEKYNSNDRASNAEKLSVLPVTIALGALSFFLVLANTSLVGSNLSSHSPKQQMEIVREMNKRMGSVNIGNGLRQFIISQQHPSYQSPATNLSLN